MDRWRILDIEQNRKSGSERPDQEARKRSTESSGMGKSGTKGASDGASNVDSRSMPMVAARHKERRTRNNTRDRSYSLRSSEIRAMTDIGKFRAVDIKDLVRFAYQDDDARMNQDLRSLRSQGLIQERTIYRAHRQSRRILTLTKQGHRILRKRRYVPGDQRLYHGFAKPREIDHDADLYKVYQKEADDIQRQGGKVTKVRLDFELKGAVNRDREAAGKLPEGQRRAWLKTVAEQHGLKFKDGTIQLPDIQIAYETPEGTIAHANIELVSENYRGDAIRSKAGAGFKVYARVGDANRVKRALQDTGAVEEILSI
jgi:DNA-binding PadR family transcriptional regulator